MSPSNATNFSLKELQIERKRYLGFIYIGGLFFFILLVGTISLKYIYSSPDKYLISSSLDAIVFESLIEISGTVFAAAIIGTIIDQYQRRIGESQDKFSAFIAEEGIVNVFKSANDPLLIQDLQYHVSNARSEIVFIGLGLGILSHNLDILENIGKRLNERKSLEVNIFIGNEKNQGVMNRIKEEKDWHLKNNLHYNETWVSRYPAEIRSAIYRTVNEKAKSRLKIIDLDDYPMATVVKIDEHFLFFMYGTPDIRGSQSPWVALDISNGSGELVRFLSSIVEYYQRTYIKIN